MSEQRFEDEYKRVLSVLELKEEGEVVLSSEGLKMLCEGFYLLGKTVEIEENTKSMLSNL